MISLVLRTVTGVDKRMCVECLCDLAPLFTALFMRRTWRDRRWRRVLVPAAAVARRRRPPPIARRTW